MARDRTEKPSLYWLNRVDPNGEMDPEERYKAAVAARATYAANGEIGALEGWSRTADRSARTAPARRRSPITLDYWIDKIRAEGQVPEKDVHKAAEAAHRAFQIRMSQRGAAAKRAAAEARRNKKTA